MRKRLLITGGVLAVVVVAFVVVFANLERIVNKNKDFFLSRAEDALGRKVSIENIGLTLRGGIGVRLDNFAIADDPAYSSEPVISAEALQVNAKFLPLLKKRFEVKNVVLRRPLIRVIRDESGLLNTSTFGAAPQTTDDGASSPDAKASGAAAPFVVSLVNIDGGTLIFIDKQNSVNLELTEIESRVEDLDLEKPIAVSVRAAFLSEKPNIELSGRFGPLADQINDLSVESSLKIDPIDIGGLLEALPSLRAAVPAGLDLAGPLTLEIDAQGTPAAMNLGLRIDATALAVHMAEQLNKPEGIPLRIEAHAHVAPPSVTIKDYVLSFHTLRASGKGEYTMTTPPSVALSLETEPAALADWGAIMPAVSPYSLSGKMRLNATVNGTVVPGSMPTVAGNLIVEDAAAAVPQLIKPITNLRTDIAFTEKSAKVTQSSLRIGSTRFEGSADIESFQPLAVIYRATSPAVALDDFRPPNPRAKKPELVQDVAVDGRMQASDATPVNRGHFRSSKGTVGDIDYSDLNGAFSIVGTQTRLEDVKAKALDGTISGGGVFEAGDTPRFNFTADAKSINIVTLFDKLPDASRQFLRGNASMKLNISGSGKDWQDIQKTISGDGLAELLNGAIIDFNLFDAVAGQLAQITGDPNVISQNLKGKYPRLFKDQNTQFKELGSDFVIENGRLLARNLNLIADDFNIAAKGSVGFDRSLQLSANLLLSKQLTADLIKDFKYASYLTNASGVIEVPFALGGTLPKANATLDANFVNGVIKKAVAQQGMNLLKDQNLGKELKNLLDFGTKKKPAPADSTSKK